MAIGSVNGPDSSCRHVFAPYCQRQRAQHQHGGNTGADRGFGKSDIDGIDDNDHKSLTDQGIEVVIA